MELQEAITVTTEAELAALGKSKTDLARALHVTPRCLQNRLSKKSSWTTDDIDVIGRFLGFSTWEFLQIASERSLRMSTVRNADSKAR